MFSPIPMWTLRSLHSDGGSLNEGILRQEVVRALVLVRPPV